MKSKIKFIIKNKINGMNISKIEFKLLKTTSPSLSNIPNIAIARNIVKNKKKSLKNNMLNNPQYE